MNKFLHFFPYVFMATFCVAMERSPKWNDQDFQRLRDAYKKQQETDRTEVQNTIKHVEQREKKRRAFNVMKIITQKLEDHGE